MAFDMAKYGVLAAALKLRYPFAFRVKYAEIDDLRALVAITVLLALADVGGRGRTLGLRFVRAEEVKRLAREYPLNREEVSASG